MQVELVQDARAELGEGPVWDPRARELIWVDITPGVVHRFDPLSGDDRALELGQPVGAVCVRGVGGYVVALRDGIALIDDTGALTLAAHLEVDLVEQRCNDGKCDPQGRFWVGTIRLDNLPGGALYRVDHDHRVTAAVTGLGLSNGLGWSPDGRSMYLIDTLASCLDVFDFDGRRCRLTHRRRLVTFAPGEGSPDGMTIDASGYLWVAAYGAGVVRRYSPDGDLALEIELPVSQPTSCTFGGAGLGDLYITSARQHLSEAALAVEPSAGALFRCRPGPVGLPATSFGG